MNCFLMQILCITLSAFLPTRTAIVLLKNEAMRGLSGGSLQMNWHNSVKRTSSDTIASLMTEMSQESNSAAMLLYLKRTTSAA